MLRSVGKESGCTLEILAADRQLDLWRLLHVLHPLALHVCSTDVEPVAIQNKPDRDLVGLPCLAPTMSQSRGLLSRYPLPGSKLVIKTERFGSAEPCFQAHAFP
jgi:hypothetical protein